MPISVARSGSRLGSLLLVLMTLAPAAARADWTTYHGDPARSGVDSSSVGSLPFASAWASPNLGGAIYAEPLVHDGVVILATESDQVVALNEATGQVAWQASVGTPVPSGQLPCGDISPTVGVTSTPVIDPATNRVFVLADTLKGSNIQHELYAFDVTTGSAVPGFPVNAEPPGDVPAAQLQRAALALDNGQIIVGYGGNAGDCSTYHGWLVSVPEAGGAEHTFEVEAGANQGAIWGAGDGPAVDSSGNVWAASGNGSGSTYSFQESVLKLDPAMNRLDSWAPSNWHSLDTSDADIGSTQPLMLPGGLVFQIGKQGIGYLLSTSSLGGVGAAPAYQASVCSGSYGGAAYSGGVIYVACSDGLRALALDTGTPSFSPIAAWQVPSAANGPAIISGGLVWVTDWNHGTLYGLNPQTGQVMVKQSTPSMEHFTTPSASDGKLFLATGQTVEAYTIANAATSPSGTGTGTGAPPPTVSPAKCMLRLRSSRVKMHHPKRRKHDKRAPAPYATVALAAKCDQAAQVKLSGLVIERLVAKTKRHKARTRTVHLASARAALKPGVARTLQLRLTPGALLALEQGVRESGTFMLSTANAGGTTLVRARGRLRR